MVNTLTNATIIGTSPSTTIAPHATLSARPRTLAPWDTNAHVTTGISVLPGSAGNAGPAVGTAFEAMARGGRDSVARQGAAPPRENPR